MQVLFKALQKLGNKSYKVGAQVVADNLAYNAKFKQLVKSGQVVILARNANEVSVQAMKDAKNAASAQKARELTKKFQAEKA
jgi:hypothetical protein